MNSNSFITSDTHFSHDRIRDLCNRPFDTITQMDEALINGINNTVDRNDTLYHLGDIVWWEKEAYILRLEWFISSVNCKNIKVCFGNHDDPEILEKYFDSVEFYREEKYNNRVIVMCHYPFASWNKKARGAINLHGHCHLLNQDWNDGLNRYDVGVDSNNFKPIHIDDILEKMKDRKIKEWYP